MVEGTSRVVDKNVIYAKSAYDRGYGQHSSIQLTIDRHNINMFAGMEVKETIYEFIDAQREIIYGVIRLSYLSAEKEPKLMVD